MSHDHRGEHGAAHRHHGAAHQHRHEPADFGRAYVVGITLNFAFVVIEVIYGLLSHLMALVADAGHNLSDVLGLGLSLGATILARRRPSICRDSVVQLVAIGVAGGDAVRETPCQLEATGIGRFGYSPRPTRSFRRRSVVESGSAVG